MPILLSLCELFYCFVVIVATPCEPPKAGLSIQVEPINILFSQSRILFFQYRVSYLLLDEWIFSEFI